MRSTRPVLVAAFAAFAMIGAAGTAVAQAPDPGDDRATAHSGNVVAADCPTLFPGSTDITAELTVSTDGTGTYLDITGIADGVEVTGVVVKGGPAYNTYLPDNLGELPWLDLHSPLVSSGRPAQISHWFACGVRGGPTTTTETPPTTTDTPPTTSDTPPTETTSPGDNGNGENGGNGNGDEELPETGADTAWLTLLGAVLLLGGGSLLLLVRLGRARR